MTSPANKSPKVGIHNLRPLKSRPAIQVQEAPKSSAMPSVSALEDNPTMLQRRPLASIENKSCTALGEAPCTKQSRSAASSPSPPFTPSPPSPTPSPPTPSPTTPSPPTPSPPTPSPPTPSPLTQTASSISQPTSPLSQTPSSLSQTPSPLSQTPSPLSQTPSSLSQTPTSLSQTPTSLSQTPFAHTPSQPSPSPPAPLPFSPISPPSSPAPIVEEKILLHAYLEDAIAYKLDKEPGQLIDLGEEVDFETRAKLVNRLIAVHRSMKSDVENLFKAVYMLDKLLTQMPLKELELCAILWIAHKSGDAGRALSVTDMLKLTMSVHARDDLLKAELTVLRLLKGDLNVESPLDFVTYYIYKLCLSNSTVILQCSQFVLSCFCLEKNYSMVLLSRQSAAAVQLSMQIFGSDLALWERISGLPGYYSLAELTSLRMRMFDRLDYMLRTHCTYRQPLDTFSLPKYGAISHKVFQKLVSDKIKT